MATSSLYPPSPSDVPEDLTKPTAEYRTQTVFLMLALAVFFLLYFTLMACCAAFLFFVLFGGWGGRNAGFVFMIKAVLTIPTLLLLIYLLKNLFKWEKAEKNDYVEIFENEHPKLFDFITQLCDEVEAPYPKRVFVNFQVNAAAMNDGNSFWHLFIPSHKNLLLGLGLVNGINLTEFKALLAHEFGHFAQKSTKTSAYFIRAMRIVDEIVYGRDVFDRFIDAWCKVHPLIAWPGWIFYGILWVLQRLLIGLRYAIFFFFFGLSRQREFNADLVAVSVAGSDAPIHLLYRSVFADRCLGQAIEDLRVAMDHHLYTGDLFYHQSHAITFLRHKEKKPTLGEPPSLPDDPKETSQVFEPDDDEIAQMWSTHPSNYDREQNAKEYYIRSEFDERSPWVLFDDVAELRERVTFKFYRFYFKVPKDVILADPEEIQGFIDEEHAETTYDPRYQGLYDKRNLFLPDVYDLAQVSKTLPWSVPELIGAHQTLYNVEVKHRAQLHNSRLEEFGLLRAISNGWHEPKDGEFEFRGEIYDARDAKRLLKKVDRELEQDHKWLIELDKRVFMTYFQMALHLSQDVAEDLFKRCRFHMDLQKIWYDLKGQDAPVGAAVNFLQNFQGDRLESHHFKEALSIFREAHHTLRDSLRLAEDMLLPPLKNMPAGQPLRVFLLEKKLLSGLSKYEQTLSMKWIQKLLNQYNEVRKKVDRIHFKSLGGILAVQERLGQEFTRRHGNPALAPPPVPPRR